MYCYKCGEKLNEEARFCHVCGTKIDMICEQEEDELDEEDFDWGAKIGTEPYAIPKFFYIYQDENVYGSKVYFVGLDDIPEKVYDNGNKYFNYDVERPFIVFDYRNNLENGFVITSSNIIWNYNYGNKNEYSQCSLYDIKEVRLEKEMKGNIMYFITHKGKICKALYLNGIDNVELFVNKFSQFVKILQDDSTIIRISENGFEIVENCNINEEQIAKICNSYRFDGMYCEVGNPLQSKKEKNARSNFDIPQNEKIYLVCDTTVFGGCRKGLAVCSSGIYFLEGGKGYADWKTFKDIPVTIGFGGLRFANLLFNTGNDGKNICKILNEIQELL